MVVVGSDFCQSPQYQLGIYMDNLYKQKNIFITLMQQMGHANVCSMAKG